MSGDPAPTVAFGRFTTEHGNGRIATAWRDLWEAMGDGQPRVRATIVGMLVDSYGLRPRTARQMLQLAVGQGHLAVVSRDHHARPVLIRAEFVVSGGQ